MSKPNNRICKICGKAFFACNSCEKFGSWRLRFCSPECFQQHILEEGILKNANSNSSFINKE